MMQHLKRFKFLNPLVIGALLGSSQTNMESNSVKQPSFGKANTRSESVKDKRPIKSKDALLLISGSGHPELAQKISDLIDVPLAAVTLGRFADGEVNLRIDSNVRGKHVYIIQSCAAPVNDNVMELLLLISCARRSGATRITAVIPYFGYKHHRRSTPVSTKFQSRFLASGAMDFAKMLETMEVNSVVSVDVQRPGQGQEACYFNPHVPFECIVTTTLFIDHLMSKNLLTAPIVVVAPNAESLQKATEFQRGIEKRLNDRRLLLNADGPTSVSNTSPPEVKLVGFFEQESGSGYQTKLELLGKAKVS